MSFEPTQSRHTEIKQNKIGRTKINEISPSDANSGEVEWLRLSIVAIARASEITRTNILKNQRAALVHVVERAASSSHQI